MKLAAVLCGILMLGATFPLDSVPADPPLTEDGALCITISLPDWQRNIVVPGAAAIPLNARRLLYKALMEAALADAPDQSLVEAASRCKTADGDKCCCWRSFGGKRNVVSNNCQLCDEPYNCSEQRICKECAQATKCSQECNLGCAPLVR